MQHGVTALVALTAVRSCGDRAVEDAPTIGRGSVLNAGTLVRRCQHATRQNDVGVRLNRRRRRDRRCGDVGLQRRGNGDRPARGGRRHITTNQARRAVGPGAGCATQQQLLPPGIELPAADAVPGCHRCHRRARLQAFGHDLALLLGRPATTALAAGGHLRVLIASAHMTSRRSVPCIQRPVHHHATLRHRPHLARNAPRSATWWSGAAYSFAGHPMEKTPRSVPYRRRIRRRRHRPRWRRSA